MSLKTENIKINSINEYINEIYKIANPKEGINHDKIRKEHKTRLMKLNKKKSSLSNYYNIILKKLTDQSDYKIYYRGHYDKNNYALIPSAFRGENWEKEDYYYHEMIVRCANQFQNSTHLDKLVRMQHYGCPTRLMDITSNPLTALYFACENFGCQECNKSANGEVIIYAVPNKQVSYFDSDKALILSCLAKFNKSEKMSILDQVRPHIQEFSKNANNTMYEDENIEKLYHEISTEVPSFKRQICPNDLITPIFIQPEKTNDRIVKQDGAFILNGLSYCENEAIKKNEALCYKKITINNQDEIKKELEALGINKATMFPEVDMVAEYLKGCN